MSCDGWSATTLGTFIALKRGFDLPEHQRIAGSVPILGSFGVTGFHNEAKVAGPGVTVGRSGASMGVATFSADDYWPLNTVLFCEDFHGNDPRFAYYLLKSLDFRGFNSGSAQPSLNRNYIAAIPLSVPPLREQRRIVGVLGAMDDKIEHNDGTCSLLEATGHLAYQRATRAGHIDTVPLATVIDVNPKRSVPAGEFAPYLEMGNMPTTGHFPVGWTQRNATSGARFVNGDTLVARITPCLENGKTAFVDFLTDGTVGCGSTEYLVLRPRPPMPLEFAYFLARDDHFRDYAIRHMSGTSGRQRVSADAIAEYMVRVPSRTELAQLSLVLRASIAMIRALRMESRTLSAIRDALLPKLVSCAIRVPDSYTPTDAPTSAAEAAGVTAP
jgi:type I restriction enzyme S subunit